MTHPASPITPQPKRRIRWRLALLIALILLIFAAIASYFLLHATPAWYQPFSITDPNVDRYAESAQARFFELHNALQRVPLGDQTWTITQDQLNSFLAAAYHSPAPGDPAASDPAPSRSGGISGPMVVFTPGRITFSGRSPKAPSRDPAGGVVSVTLNIQILSPSSSDPTAMGLITLHSVWVGSLPVPRSLVQNRIDNVAAALTPAIKQSLAGYLGPHAAEADMPQIIGIVNHIFRGEPFPLTFSTNHRKLVIKDIRVTQGEFAITLAPG